LHRERLVLQRCPDDGRFAALTVSLAAHADAAPCSRCWPPTDGWASACAFAWPSRPQVSSCRDRRQEGEQGQRHRGEAFLRSLDVSQPPKLVIADDNAAIANAVRAVWPAQPSPSLPVPFVARCEHHLHVNGVEAMEGDGIGGWAHWLRRRLDTAFLRTEGWDELHEKAVGFVGTQAWLTGIANIGT
jgi:hypothetical protein